jgi:hypothetical protein
MRIRQGLVQNRRGATLRHFKHARGERWTKVSSSAMSAIIRRVLQQAEYLFTDNNMR